MMGEKRTSTTPGIGAVRAHGSSPRMRRVAITCPSMKAAVVEDVSERGVDSSRRPDTLRRTTSSDSNTRTLDVALGASPRARANAANVTDLDLEPADAFLLSRVDGELSVADLADLTGMLPKDVFASLARLVRAGLVEVE
jgi:hypothetical protein